MKISKSMYLNREICDRLDPIMERTGITYSRIVTVALITLIAGGVDEHPSYSTWMRATMKLNKGKATLDEVLQMIREGTK